MMQNLAMKIDPERRAPELKVAAPPLYMTGIQVRGNGNRDWEVFTEDFSRRYTTDSRWCGGRFTVWSLEKTDGYKLTANRTGYLDNDTGVYFFGRRAGEGG